MWDISGLLTSSSFLFCERKNVLRVDLNPWISKICASWMTVWNISANYVLVPLKFNLNWNIWNPFLKTSPLDFSGQRLGNTSLAVFLRFHISQVVKWPEFVRLYTTNSLILYRQSSLIGRGSIWHSWGRWFAPDPCLTFHSPFYIPVCILQSKTNHFGKDSQSKLSNDHYQSLAYDTDRSRVPHVKTRMI